MISRGPESGNGRIPIPGIDFSYTRINFARDARDPKGGFVKSPNGTRAVSSFDRIARGGELVERVILLGPPASENAEAAVVQNETVIFEALT